MSAAVTQRPGRLDLELVKGDDASLELTFADADAVAVDLSGRAWSLRISGPGLYVELDSAVDTTDEATGVLVVPFAAATTAAIGRDVTWALRDTTNARTLLDGELRAYVAGHAGAGSSSIEQTVTITNATAAVTVTAAVVGPPGSGGGGGGGFSQAQVEEFARDALAAALVAGANITITPNDGSNTITIAGTGGGGSGTVDVVSNVTGPSLLGRASGTGDSEELTAAQVQEMLGVPGVVLHRETLALDTAVKSYDVTGWAKIRVEFTGRGTRNATILGLLATLNGNTGNVYSTNAAALTSSLALGNVPGSSTNTNRRGMVNAEIDLTSGAYKEGLAWSTNVGSTATVGQAPANVGLWSTITDAVTSIELKMQLDNIAAGARIRIIGLEAA